MTRGKAAILHATNANLAAKLANIENIKEEVESCNTVEGLIEFKSCVGNKQKELVDFQDKITDLDIDDITPLLHELNKLEKALRSILCHIGEKIGSLSKKGESFAHGNQINDPVVTSSQLKSKLPTLDLPIFNGDLTSYLVFWESFQSIINSRNDLSNLDKFQYFQSLLRNEPYAFVSGQTMSAENYPAMLVAFEKKFKKTNELVYLHLDQIISALPIKKKNPHQLGQLVYKVRTALQSLKLLKQPVEHWDAIIIKITLDKIDSETLEKWNMSCQDYEVPKLSVLLEFLEKVAESQKVSTDYHHVSIHTNITQKQAAAKISCPHCRQSHSLFSCPSFEKLDVRSRYKKVLAYQLCTNCFSKSHVRYQCPSKKNCKRCGKRGHHTMLHFENNFPNSNRATKGKSNRKSSENLTARSSSLNTSSSSISESREDKSNRHPNGNLSTPSPSPNTISSAVLEPSQKTNTCLTRSTDMAIILPTALISIHNGATSVTARCLIDTGSQSTCMTRVFANQLNIRRCSASFVVSGIVNNQTSRVNETIQFSFSPRHKPSIRFEAKALILDKLTTDLPESSFQLSNYEYLNSLTLADPSFNQSLPIDVIIGGREAFDILAGGQRLDSHDGSLIALDTQLGWIIMGSCSTSTTSGRQVSTHIQVKNSSPLGATFRGKSRRSVSLRNSLFKTRI